MTEVRVSEVRVADLLHAIRNESNGKPPASGSPDNVARSAIPTLTALDFLAAQAPSAIPGWFRAEHFVPTGVPVPDKVQRADDEAARHGREFDKSEPPSPNDRAAYDQWFARRSASVEAVNAMARLAEPDLKVYSATVHKIAGIDEARLLIRWRFWWASQALAIRGEFLR